ncbi:MAG: PorV/PorQ family protein [Rhodothermia bacterium]|nr:PorV/PorQ family protein [Rhodothermia bacterium]
MRHKIVTYIGLAAILLGLSAQEVLGQGEDRRGTAGATYLLLPVTARTAALGNTSTSGFSSMSGIEALHSNPAGLVFNSGTNALFSNMQYFADINVNTFGIAQRVGSGSLALVVTSWDFGDIPLTTELQPEVTDVTFSPAYLQFGASYARQLTDRIAAGVTVKLLSEDIDRANATGLALDAGMGYTVGETGLRFGVALKNFGPGMTYTGNGLTQQVRLPGAPPNATTQAVSIEAAGFELPTVLNFGVSYTRQVAADVSLGVLGNFRSNSFAQDQFSGGLELGLRNILFVRGAYEWQEDMDQTAFEGWSVGAGLNFEFSGRSASVDYSYQGAEFFDEVQMFTVSVVL